MTEPAISTCFEDICPHLLAIDKNSRQFCHAPFIFGVISHFVFFYRLIQDKSAIQEPGQLSINAVCSMFASTLLFALCRNISQHTSALIIKQKLLTQSEGEVFLVEGDRMKHPLTITATMTLMVEQMRILFSKKRAILKQESDLPVLFRLAQPPVLQTVQQIILQPELTSIEIKFMYLFLVLSTLSLTQACYAQTPLKVVALVSFGFGLNIPLGARIGQGLPHIDRQTKNADFHQYICAASSII